MRPERCSHAIGGLYACRYCGRRTCSICHHAKEHLDKCPETKQRETRQ
jgi:hypothetical protein